MRRLKLENFYIHSSLFGLLSLGAAALNYLLYPALTRILNIGSFGDFTAIMALSNQILGVLLAFNLTSIYLVKKYPEKVALELSQAIQKVLIWLCLGSAVILLLLAPLLRTELHIASPLSLVALVALLLVAVPTVIWTGYLQGHKQLLQVGLFNISSAALKLIFVIVLAHLGGVAWGLSGVVIGTLGGLLVLRVSAGRALPSLSSIFTSLSKDQRAFIGSTRYYILESIVVVGMLSLLQNIDIVYAKSLFSPSTAGVYGGVSILSNALYIVSFLLIWIILPEVTVTPSSHNRRIIRTAFTLFAGMGLGVIAAEILLQAWLTRLILGPAFTGQGLILIVTSTYQIALVGVTLYAYYLLVRKKMSALILATCVSAPTVLAPIAVPPKNPTALIATLLGALIFGCVMFISIMYMQGVARYVRPKTAN